MAYRIHERRDLQFQIIKGWARFSRAAYACVITQSTAYDDQRAIYHIETFYGSDGRKLRAAAMKYGRDVVTGRKLPGPYRDQHLPSGFHSFGLPPREDQIEIRT
jgi:hypothetical protein